MCPDGATESVAYHVRVDFEVTQATSIPWRFRQMADWGGHGGWCVDDDCTFVSTDYFDYHEWEGALAAGHHVFESIGFDPCCDGDAYLAFRAPSMADYAILTLDALHAAAGDEDCPATCAYQGVGPYSCDEMIHLFFMNTTDDAFSPSDACPILEAQPFGCDCSGCLCGADYSFAPTISPVSPTPTPTTGPTRDAVPAIEPTAPRSTPRPTFAHGGGSHSHAGSSNTALVIGLSVPAAVIALGAAVAGGVVLYRRRRSRAVEYDPDFGLQVPTMSGMYAHLNDGLGDGLVL